MQKYEIMAIIENSLDAKAAEAYATENIVGRIEKEFGGKITFSDFWGERGFAYQINKQTWGYYVVYQFEMDGAQTTEFRHELNLDQKVVRFLVTKVDPRAGTPKVYAEMKAEYEAQEKKAAAEKAKKAEERAAKNPHKREKLSTVKETPKKEAVETEEPPKDAVDKKLDAIIDESAGDL